MSGTDWLLHAFASYLAGLGLALVYGAKGKMIWAAAAGALVSWMSYRLGLELMSRALAYFVATLALSTFSEVMARWLKAPSTVFLTIALLPLVPGAGIYFTMRAFVSKDMGEFARLASETMGIAGMLALGVLLVTTLVRIPALLRQRRDESGT